MRLLGMTSALCAMLFLACGDDGSKGSNGSKNGGDDENGEGGACLVGPADAPERCAEYDASENLHIAKDLCEGEEAKGEWTSACPTEGVVGTCADFDFFGLTGTEYWYEIVGDVEEMIDICDAISGTWQDA